MKLTIRITKEFRRDKSRLYLLYAGHTLVAVAETNFDTALKESDNYLDTFKPKKLSLYHTKRHKDYIVADYKALRERVVNGKTYYLKG